MKLARSMQFAATMLAALASAPTLGAQTYPTGNDPRKFFRMAYSHAPLKTVQDGAKKLGQIIRGAARKAA